MIGRPAHFENPQLLQQAIELYFAKCLAEKKHPTITGLAYSVGFESRQSFYDYEKHPDFSYTVKRARLFVESTYEDALRNGNPAGAIFALKNFGWKDKFETGFTDNDGNDVVPIQFYIPDNGRQNKDNKAAEGLPGESTQQPG